MIDNKKVLGVIPARGGSKGIPHKNIVSVLGRPLIDWTVAEARLSRYLDTFILSSEDENIIAVAQSLGCPVPFKRPVELAADDTPGIDPIIHATQMMTGYDYVVVLQPTSPLRLAADIDTCIEMCINKAAKTCISVVEMRDNPYWSYKISSEGALSPLMENSGHYTRRQDLPKVYIPNGAVYVAEIATLQNIRSFINLDTLAYVMPEERSLDIDTPLDLDYFQYLICKQDRI